MIMPAQLVPLSSSADWNATVRPALHAKASFDADLLLTAIQADTTDPTRFELKSLWTELCLGQCKVVESIFTESRCLLVTRAVSSPVALHGTKLGVLQAILEGVSQKAIALELSVAPSTVASHARFALEHLGFRQRPSQVPPLLMLAAKAARDPATTPEARVSFIASAGDQLRVVSAVRPDLDFDLIPPAEFSVLQRIVEGWPYADIARHRGTSTRTIANQLTAVFRRLRVSGRRELILRLYQLCADAGAAHAAGSGLRRREVWASSVF